MATNTKDPRSDPKRTKVKDLRKPEARLKQEEMKKVKGGAVGPCDRERRYR